MWDDGPVYIDPLFPESVTSAVPRLNSFLGQSQTPVVIPSFTGSKKLSRITSESLNKGMREVSKNGRKQRMKNEKKESGRQKRITCKMEEKQLGQKDMYVVDYI